MELKLMRRAYGLLLWLSSVDLVLVCASQEYRNALGRVQPELLPTLVRLTPGAVLMLLCVVVLARLRRNPKAGMAWAAGTSAVFAILGASALLPWIGMFAATLTPMAGLYLAALLWIPNGLFLAMSIAVVFTAANSWVAKVAFKQCGSTPEAG
jgi:hypothetical protein